MAMPTLSRPFIVKPKQFGARLRQLREEAGVSQKELADHLKLSDATISQWEGGVRSPNFVVVVKIAEFLKKEMNDFAVIPDEIRPRTAGRPKRPSDN